MKIFQRSSGVVADDNCCQNELCRDRVEARRGTARPHFVRFEDLVASQHPVRSFRNLTDSVKLQFDRASLSRTVTVLCRRLSEPSLPSDSESAAAGSSSLNGRPDPGAYRTRSRSVTSDAGPYAVIMARL